jgi:endoglucanase
MKRRTLLKLLGAAGAAAFGSRAIPAHAQSASPAPATPSVLSGIFFNQLGFQPNRAKLATLVSSATAATSFRVRSDATGEVAFTGQLTAPLADAASGDTVRQADFSALRTPGLYRLEIDGAASDRFPIRDDVYAAALRLTLRAYYGQRCGCAVDLGDGYKHGPCHLHGEYHPSSGKSGKSPSNGGWHDAGDYGRYVVNSGITCGTLLWAWEIFPESLRTLALDIPESGHATPDALAEIRWNLEWMLSLQDSNSSLQDSTSSLPDTGGVFHKQTSEQFCSFIMPEDDRLTSYIIGTGAQPYKSTCATADLAAVMAIAARCYHPFDAPFATRCLAAARHAFAWAAAHPDVLFTNPPGVATGGYGDQACGDEILWAAAELFRTTGEPAFEQAFLAELGSATLTIDPPGWGNLASMACWTYLLSNRESTSETPNAPGTPNASSAIRPAIREATLRTADRLVQQARANGYGNTLSRTEYNWGSNSVAGNHSLLLLIADRIAPNPEYVEAALNNLHYLLGRNCLGVSWVTQLGTRPFLHPHHRPSAADKNDKPWPGLLSGGPNSGRNDDVAKTLPDLPPMRMWIDDQRAYSVNEVAINWNAPLVFLLAAANAAPGNPVAAAQS